MIDFWATSGYSSLVRAPVGRPHVVDACLRRNCARRELAPIAKSCEAERVLHAALRPGVAGAPSVFTAPAMHPYGALRMKRQNVSVNPPLARMA